MMSGQTTRARQYFLDALAVDPANVPARQSLVALDEMEGRDPADVVRLCEEIQRLAPETPGVMDCIGRNRARLKP